MTKTPGVHAGPMAFFCSSAIRTVLICGMTVRRSVPGAGSDRSQMAVRIDCRVIRSLPPPALTSSSNEEVLFRPLAK